MAGSQEGKSTWTATCHSATSSATNSKWTVFTWNKVSVLSLKLLQNCSFLTVINLRLGVFSRT